MKIIPVVTEVWHIDAGVAFGVIPRSIWSRFYDVGDNNLLPLTNRCLLVESSDRLVLIDTGFGNKRDPKYYQFKYITEHTSLSAAIRSAGYKPESVTDVIFTHLHDDHVGGAVEKLADGTTGIVCRNARHHISKKQWDSAVNPNKREAAAYFRDNIEPLLQAGVINYIEKEEEIVPGISVLLRDGHTSGQMLPLMHTPSQMWLYAADFIPSISHISPVWVASVDVMPILALEEKEEFLHLAIEENIGLIFEHDYYNETAEIVKSIKGFEGIPGVSLPIE